MLARRLPLFLVFAVLVVRLSTLGEGALAWVDEQRYVTILLALRRFWRGEFADAGVLLFSGTHARPGMIAAFFIPAALQIMREHMWHVPLLLPKELLIPTAANAIFATIACAQVYLIAKRSFRSPGVLPAASAFLFSVTVPSFFYTRHLVPYYAALCFFLWGCLLLLQPRRASAWVHFWLGVLAALSFATYPGYYFVMPVLGLALCLQSGADWLRALVRFVLGAVIVLLVSEGLAALYGFSYLGMLAALSNSVTIGSFEESFLFIPRYVLQVDRLVGAMLLVGWIVLLLTCGVRKGREAILAVVHPGFISLVLLLTVLIFVHAGLGYFARHMVFYGRLVLPLYPFLAVSLLAVLAALVRPVAVRNLALVVVFAAATATFFSSFTTFQRLAYPRDVLQHLGITAHQRSELRFVDEIDNCQRCQLPLNAALPNIGEGRQLSLVNFCDFLPVRRLLPEFQPSPGSACLFIGPHFLNFSAYRYEGLTPEERTLIVQKKPRIAVYAR
jgi:hypothetical protein